MALKLEIVLNDNGSVTVSGPFQNKIICYGMLEAAKGVVQAWSPDKKPLIEIPEFIAPTDLPKFEN